MGLFSFLKKKNEAPEARAGARPRTGSLSSPASAFAPTTRMPLDTEAERERQREIARATAAKIDEIELEMAADIFDDHAWAGNRRAPAVVSGAPSAPLLDLNTADLLVEEGVPDAAVAPSSAPAVEEAAILFANGQAEAAEQALRACLDGSCRSERQPWWMLFDLYQVSGREPEFESIAIDYASHFETSPPAYSPMYGPSSAPSSGQPYAGVAPTATLSGQLDDAVGAQLARVLTSNWPLVRLDFSTVASATPEGCAVLLAALQTLRRAGRELVMAGADHLIAVLRPMLAIGERGAGEAPWLLLLELLLLMNREKDFEETAMDYCVTFEVSPPSFEAPAHTAVSVGATAGSDAAAGDRFLLPGLIEGGSTALLDAIGAYAAQHASLVLDCSRLARIDYAAATALGACLRQLAGDAAHPSGKRSIELRDLNHLVAALLRLLGVGDHARLYANKY
ncbi:STAS domain-containing protein [Massilia sp. LXY-6]|uniref:STAS domain-containing protein n=1 Tax=Massilia sp. LXY-6 TaxID=3379823 RepID=UPI003EE1BCD4